MLLCQGRLKRKTVHFRLPFLAQKRLVPMLPNRGVKHDVYGQLRTVNAMLLLIIKALKFPHFHLSRSFEKLLDIWS